jgi:hypothetical protein
MVSTVMKESTVSKSCSQQPVFINPDWDICPDNWEQKLELKVSKTSSCHGENTWSWCLNVNKETRHSWMILRLLLTTRCYILRQVFEWWLHNRRRRERAWSANSGSMASHYIKNNRSRSCFLTTTETPRLMKNPPKKKKTTNDSYKTWSENAETSQRFFI